MGGYEQALRVAIANHLNETTYRVPDMPVHPNDIADIVVRWDEGETSDNEDYGLSPRHPALTVEVRVDHRRDVRGHQVTHYQSINPEVVLTALLRAVMKVGL